MAIASRLAAFTALVAMLLLLDQRAVSAAPPSISLTQPVVEGYFATVNGLTLPGVPDTEITRIEWDWGDGSIHDAFFPATHLYPRPGTYTLEVTSFQSDGSEARGTVDVTVEPLLSRGEIPLIARDANLSPSGRTLPARLTYAEEPPLIDPRVRRALAAAAATALVTWEPATAPEDAVEQPFDPATADALLVAAGYPAGLGVMLLIEDVPTYRAIATLLWAEWKATLGVAPGLEIVPSAEYKARLAAGTFQAALGTLD
jgi:hypothetical protein